MTSTDDKEWDRRVGSLAESNKFLFEEHINCDVAFLIKYPPDGKTTRIEAHKCILLSRSPVFHALFCGTIPPPAGDIDIDDIPADTFLDLLRFIYYEHDHVTADSVASLLYCAKKYMITQLVNNCLRYLENNISDTTVFTILEISLMFLDEESLKNKCLEHIQKRASTALKSDSFTHISHEALETILKLDKVSMTEVVLFECCVEWAKKRSLTEEGLELRKVLVNILPYIRFPTMSSAEFGKSVAPLGILTKDEVNEVFMYVAYNENPVPRFSTKKRKFCPSVVMLGEVYYTVVSNRNGGVCGAMFDITTERSVKLASLSFVVEEKSSDQKYAITNLLVKQNEKSMVYMPETKLVVEPCVLCLQNPSQMFRIAQLSMGDDPVSLEPGRVDISWNITSQVTVNSVNPTYRMFGDRYLEMACLPHTSRSVSSGGIAITIHSKPLNCFSFDNLYALEFH